MFWVITIEAGPLNSNKGECWDIGEIRAYLETFLGTFSKWRRETIVLCESRVCVTQDIPVWCIDLSVIELVSFTWCRVRPSLYICLDKLVLLSGVTVTLRKACNLVHATDLEYALYWFTPLLVCGGVLTLTLQQRDNLAGMQEVALVAWIELTDKCQVNVNWQHTDHILFLVKE